MSNVSIEGSSNATTRATQPASARIDLRRTKTTSSRFWSTTEFLGTTTTPNTRSRHLRDCVAALRGCPRRCIEEYLILLSVCQTCKYIGVDFLDFLRSGEKDIHAFAESRRRRRKPPLISVTPVQS